MYMCVCLCVSMTVMCVYVCFKPHENHLQIETWPEVYHLVWEPV